MLILALQLCGLACGEATWEGRWAGDCADDADNDADGLFDCNDPDCSGAPVCQPEVAPEEGGWAFVDRAEEAGLHEDERDTYQVGGRGLAVADVDNNGWPDLWLTGRQGIDSFVANRLYLNQGDGTFAEVRAEWGLPDGESPHSDDEEAPPFGPSGATFADYDNDGDPDLFLANEGANQLFRNDGDRFLDVSAEAGIGGGIWLSAGVALADYDRDGLLDLFVTNNLDLDKPGEDGFWSRPPDPLYRNEGDGSFTDVSAILPVPEVEGAGFAAAWADFDNDGDPDLYVANDHGHALQPNQLYRNDGLDGEQWRFTRVSSDCSCELAIGAMGISLGDFDRDEHLDLYVTNLLMDGGEVLLAGDGQLGFVDRSLDAGAVAGLSEVRESSWGSQSLDFNRDGWLDLFVVFGTWDEQAYPSPNVLLQGGEGGFRVLGKTGVEDRISESEGTVALDYDLDGCIDLAVQNLDGQPSLYRGRCDGPSQWLGFRLEGQESNRDAVGAVVRLTTSVGPQRRQVTAGSTSVYSARWKTLHFGLAQGEELLGAEVSWPSGTVEDLGIPPLGRYLRLLEGEGILDEDAR